MALNQWPGRLLFAGLMFALAFGGARVYQWQQQNKQIAAEIVGYTGGGFTLQSADGDVSLDDFKGRVVLLYFGYSYCPDVCPTSLAVMAAAMNQLGAASGVKGLFISFDPERDSVQRLQTYTSKFHPDITGLTASAPRILEVATRYGVYYQKVKRSDDNYLMDHTSPIYVIDTRGELVGVMNLGTPPERLAARVQGLL